MLRSFASAVVLMLLVGATLVPATVAAPRGGVPMTTTLTGAAEIPGPGDPDGSGTASLTFNPGREEVCFELSVSNITLSTTGAHIHSGTATQSGGVVVALIPPDETGTSSGCVSADRALILDIIRNPENYYVNVHTVLPYAAGAVRGQLG